MIDLVVILSAVLSVVSLPVPTLLIDLEYNPLILAFIPLIKDFVIENLLVPFVALVATVDLVDLAVCVDETADKFELCVVFITWGGTGSEDECEFDELVLISPLLWGLRGKEAITLLLAEKSLMIIGVEFESWIVRVWFIAGSDIDRCSVLAGAWFFVSVWVGVVSACVAVGLIPSSSSADE